MSVQHDIGEAQKPSVALSHDSYGDCVLAMAMEIWVTRLHTSIEYWAIVALQVSQIGQFEAEITSDTSIV